LNLLKFIDIENISRKKEIFIDQKGLKKSLYFFKKNNLKKNDLLICISVTAGKNFKEWSPDKFSKLADRIIDELKAKVIFTGSERDEIIIKKFNF